MSARVLVVSPYRGEYGPPQTLEHVCRAVTAAGFEPVCVVAPDAHLTAALLALAPRVRVLEGLGTFPRTLNALRLGRFFHSHLGAASRLQAIAVEEQARAIYSISEATFAGSLAAMRIGIPSIVHVIGMSIQTPRWSGSVYVRFLDRLTDQFIACSSAVAEMLARFDVPDERVTVVHNGIDVAAVDATGGAPAPFSHAGPAVGIVAAYDPRKGHELFIDAARILAVDHPDARFYLLGGVIAGQPESEAFASRVTELLRESGLEDRFVRPGFIAAPEVYRWIRALDVVVVPSRTEAFAHALLEAMACERAVVATGIEGNLDAFVHGHSGVYVPRRPEAVAAAVDELLRGPAERERLGRNARERVGIYFDLDVTLPAIASTVRQIASTIPSPG